MDGAAADAASPASAGEDLADLALLLDGDLSLLLDDFLSLLLEDFLSDFLSARARQVAGGVRGVGAGDDAVEWRVRAFGGVAPGSAPTQLQALPHWQARSDATQEFSWRGEPTPLRQHSPLGMVTVSAPRGAGVGDTGQRTADQSALSFVVLCVAFKASCFIRKP